MDMEDALNVALGNFVLLVSLTLKLPLIYNCITLRSTKGLVASTFYFEILAVIGQIMYNVANGFPLSTWAELVNVIFQDSIVVALIWYYRAVPARKCIFYLFLLYTYCYVGLNYVPSLKLLWIFPTFKTLSTLVVVLPQIVKNHQNGHTGAQSFVTMCLIVMLRIIRVYTAFSVVGDPQLCAQYCVSLFFNGVLLLQILLMRGKTKLVMESTTASNQTKTQEDTLLEPRVDEVSDAKPQQESSKTKRISQTLAKDIDAMVDNLVKAVDSEANEWIDALVAPAIHVQRHVVDPYKLRIRALLDGNPDTAFAVMTDIKSRLEWDVTTEEAYVVESYDAHSHIVYSRGKSMWPVAPRDMVLLSTKRRLEDGRLASVVKSVQHVKAPEGMVPGCVRGEAKTMGTVLSQPAIGFNGFDGSGQVHVSAENVKAKCIASQIGHVDPKGNIPGWLVKMVATKYIPRSLELLNERIKVTPRVEKWSSAAPPATQETVAQESVGMSDLDSAFSLQRLQKNLQLLTLKVERLERLQYGTIIVFILYMLFKARK